MFGIQFEIEYTLLQFSHINFHFKIWVSINILCIFFKKVLSCSNSGVKSF